MPIYLCIYLSIDLSISLSSNYRIYLSIYLSICLSVCLSICKLENEAILGDFLSFWTWQHQKRNNSARLPQFLHLTTSKTKQFCETSSFFKLTTSKTKQFCETSFKNGKLSAELTASYQCVLRLFDSICLNYCVCHEKKSHTMCCTCQASSQQTWRSDAPKCNPSQEISARTSQQLWWTCLLYCTCHGKCIFADPLQVSHPCHRFWTCYKTHVFCSLLTLCAIPCACHAKRHLNAQSCPEPLSFFYFWLRNVLRATTACTFSTSQLPKVVLTWCVLYVLTSKCASRHNGVHFFDSATSKSAPKLRCFVHFDLEMCFTPQRRALFRHLNFQKWSEHGVLWTFWLWNVLRAATACNFSSRI